MSSPKKPMKLPYKATFEPEYIQVSELTAKLMKQMKEKPQISNKISINQLNNQLFELTDAIQQNQFVFLTEDLYIRYATLKEAEQKMKTRSDVCPSCGKDQLKKIVQCEFCAEVYCKQCCWRKRIIPAQPNKDAKNCCQICHKKFVKLLANQIFYQEKQILFKIVETSRKKIEKTNEKASEKEKVLSSYNIKKRNDKIKENTLQKKIQEQQKKLKQIQDELMKIVKIKSEKIRQQEERLAKKKQQDERLQKQLQQQQQRRKQILEQQRQKKQQIYQQQIREKERIQFQKKQLQQELRKKEEIIKNQENARQQQQSQRKVQTSFTSKKQISKVSSNENENSKFNYGSKEVQKLENSVQMFEEQHQKLSFKTVQAENKTQLQQNFQEELGIQKQQSNSLKKLRQSPMRVMPAQQQVLLIQENKKEQSQSVTTSKSSQQAFTKDQIKHCEFLNQGLIEKEKVNDKPLKPNQMSINDILSANIQFRADQIISSPMRLSKRQSISSQLEIECEGQSPSKSPSFSKSRQQDIHNSQVKEQPIDDIKLRRQSLLRESSLMSSVKSQRKQNAHPNEEESIDTNNKCTICQIM